MQAGWIRQFGKELADKWQIPTLILAVLLMVFGVHHLLSLRKQTSMQEYLDWCHRLIEQKDYSRAGILVTELLKDSAIEDSVKAQLHLLAARIIHDTEVGLTAHSPSRLQAFHFHFKRGTPHRSLTVDDHRMLANVYRWENRFSEAVAHGKAVLEANVPDRVAVLKQLIEWLPRTEKSTEEEYQRKLDDLLACRDLTEADRVWALDLKTEILFKSGQFDRAVEMLQKALPRVRDEDHKLHLQYSLALGQFYQGRIDPVEPVLRDILDRLKTRTELEAKVGLLLGRLCGKDDRPEEAGAFFDRVIEAHPLTDYHLAALVGKAESRVRLQRYAEAQAEYQESLRLLDTLGPNPRVNRGQILASVERTALHLYQSGNLEQALVFAHLQNQSLEDGDDRTRQGILARIGTWHRQWAQVLARQAEKGVESARAQTLRVQSRDHYRQAGDAFLLLSQTAGLVDKNSALELWKAAQCYEKGGLIDQAQSILERFVRDWPHDANLPEALFKLADIYRTKNELTPAETCYRRLINEFPRTPFGQQSLTPLARCYFSRGPQGYDQAEQVLRGMVDDTSNQDQFRPDSAEFRAALFLLGKVHYYQGRYDQCVGRLEEALERYPDNRSEPEARFLIAQSYRKIAEQTDQKIAQTSDRSLRTLLARSRQENLERARELYERAIVVFEKMPRRETREDTYLQLSHLYAADSLYDLGRFDQAIQAYERVIERYEKTVLALDSYVQIVNSLQRLGQVRKIKAVLERMKWLLRQMPDEALAARGRPFSRADWEAWIDWNYQSGLLDVSSPVLMAKGADPPVTD